MPQPTSPATPQTTSPPDTGFVRGLGLLDSIMAVAGAMIGSGVFIVSADMARQIGSPGGLLAGWFLTGVLTVAAALSYGELAAMMYERAAGYTMALKRLKKVFDPKNIMNPGNLCF